MLDTPGTQPGARVRRIDIDDVRVTGGPHANFPLLVSVTAPWLATTGFGGNVARSDAFDLYFTADQAGTMQLAHEVEAYAEDAGTLTAWVKIPSLTAQTALYIHYGDPMLANDPQNVAAVWSGYEAVFHLDAFSDAAGKNPQIVAVTSGAVAGRIDVARAFDGDDDSVDVGSATAIDDIFTGGGTAEAWFYAETFGEGTYGRIFEKGHVAGWSIFVNNTERASSTGFLHGTTTGDWGWWNTPASSITLNAWHHVAVVYSRDSSANNALMYLDGAPVAVALIDAPTGTMVSDASQPLRLGNRPALDRTFDGLLDELRLSTVVRGDGWLATQVRNQVDPAAFAPIGPEL
ncbi:MAG TPA: LamG domain-containing protein [Kofleriaceae bacterium]